MKESKPSGVSGVTLATEETSCKCVINMKTSLLSKPKQRLLGEGIFTSQLLCKCRQTVCLPPVCCTVVKIEVSKAVCAVLTKNTRTERLFASF